MVLTVQFQLNPCAEPFVPTATANKTVQHRRRNREEGEAPRSKHQTRARHGEWVGRRGIGRPNPSRETKISGANGGGERRKSVPEKYRKQKNKKKTRRRRGGRNSWRGSEGGEVEQGVVPRGTKRKVRGRKSVGTSSPSLPTTCVRWRWTGSTAWGAQLRS